MTAFIGSWRSKQNVSNVDSNIWYPHKRGERTMLRGFAAHLCISSIGVTDVTSSKTLF